MSDGLVIVGVDARAPSFARSFARIQDSKLKQQIRASLGCLIQLRLDQAPDKLHIHPLKNKLVQSALNPNLKVKAWTIHATQNDVYKISFTLENGVAYLRLCDTHDRIDASP